VSADLSILHAICMCICGLSGCTELFPQYLVKGAIFVKNITERKMYRLIFWTTFTFNICHSKKNRPRYGQKCKFSRQIFEINYQMLLKSVVPCARTDGQTDMTYLAVAFRNFVSAPNKARVDIPVHIHTCTDWYYVNIHTLLNESNDSVNAIPRLTTLQPYSFPTITNQLLTTHYIKKHETQCCVPYGGIIKVTADIFPLYVTQSHYKALNVQTSHKNFVTVFPPHKQSGTKHFATVTNHNQCRMSATACTSPDLHYTCTHLCVLRVYELLLVSHLAVRSTVTASTSRTASNWMTSLISCINESASVLSFDDPRAYKIKKPNGTRNWKQQQNLRIVTSLCLLRYLKPYLQN